MARILVIDDSPTVIYCLDQVLRRVGHRVVGVANRIELEDALPGTAPGGGYDLVLLDLRVPGMDPAEAVRLCRLRLGSGVPVVLHSCHTAEELAPERERLGVSEVMEKSFDPDEMIRQVDDLLRRFACDGTGGGVAT